MPCMVRGSAFVFCAADISPKISPKRPLEAAARSGSTFEARRVASPEIEADGQAVVELFSPWGKDGMEGRRLLTVADQTGSPKYILG